MVCAVSYILSFYIVYKQRKNAKTKAATAARRKAKTEAKLAVAGMILFFMTFCCGIFCVSLVSFTFSFDVLLFMIGKFGGGKELHRKIKQYSTYYTCYSPAFDRNKCK